MDSPLTRRQWFREAARSITAASLLGSGCGATGGIPLPNESTGPPPGDDYELVARLAHISDAHLIDEETPARLPFAKGLVPVSWRAYERYSTQLLDGVIRAINRYHELRGTIGFVVHTGDAADNRQNNELRWFLDTFDGKLINPSSGPDDRAAEQRGPEHLDAHAPFQAQGLYRQGAHGDKPSIPWYALAGNHDTFALGTFPVTRQLLGSSLTAPLPLSERIGLFLPTALDPTSSVAYSPITPAYPGPPVSATLPTRITPNSARRYFTRDEFVAAHFETVTGPPGHGFADPVSSQTWYSVTPVAGLRLIALDSCRPTLTLPAGFYAEGAIDAEQMAFLRNELRAAQQREELVIVLTHHPSRNLHWLHGSVVSTKELRETLNRHPCVVAHLAAHEHRNRVWDHGGYVEFETAATLDYPQEGRFIEIWKSAEDIQLRYEVFSHLPDVKELAAQFEPDDDPLLEMRLLAYELAAADPVVPGLAPPEQLIEEIVGPIRDLISGISEEFTEFSEEFTSLRDEITGDTIDVADHFLKSDVPSRSQAARSGSSGDRAGVITLPRR